MDDPRSNQAGCEGAIAKPQYVVRHDVAAASPPQAKDSSIRRCIVEIVSFRKRLLDIDNLCPKFHVDALRYLGLIPGDSPDLIDLRVRQEKVKRDFDVRTQITITPL